MTLTLSPEDCFSAQIYVM